MRTEEQNMKLALDLKIFSAKMIVECRQVISNPDTESWRRKVYEDYLSMFKGFLMAPVEDLV